MALYKGMAGNSGVLAFDILNNGIILTFKHGGRYLYNFNQPGRVEVEEMKRRAVAGNGLATYVNKHVRKRYARKL